MRLTIYTPDPRYLLAFLAVLLSSGCSGNARPDAIVTEVGGLPCFAVPESRQTRGGIPLFGLLVSQRPPSGSTENSREFWSVSVEPDGASIITRPSNRICYGAAPAGTKAAPALTLEPHQVYSIDLNARPKNSNIHSYSAEFCIKLSKNGKAAVQIVPWDERSKQWRYGVCDRP